MVRASACSLSPSELEQKGCIVITEMRFDMEWTDSLSKESHGRTVQNGNLTGKAPSFVLSDDGRVFVLHDCVTRRAAVLLNTDTFFGWTFGVSKDGTMMHVSPAVTCSLCGLHSWVFAKDA